MNDSFVIKFGIKLNDCLCNNSYFSLVKYFLPIFLVTFNLNYFRRKVIVG